MTLWILLGVVVAVLAVYVTVMRNAYRNSRELDKKIDYRKMRKWTDD